MKSAPPRLPGDLPEQLPDLGASVGAAYGRGVHARPMREAAVSASPAEPLRAPWPWFGGKARVATRIWERLGDPQNYVEPFAGSSAVLLARPHAPQVETLNDADCFVSNAWRAIQRAPELTASFCDQPVNEADLHSVHRWLVFGPEEEQGFRRHLIAALEALARGDAAGAEVALRAGLAEDRPLGPAFRARMRRDPDYFDPEIAGRWIWGLCAWIGSGWCTSDPDEFDRNDTKRPSLGGGNGGGDSPHHGKGVHAQKMRVDRDAGARPDLSAAGRGVHAPAQRGLHEKLPRVGAGGGGSGADHGVGVHAKGMRELPQKRPILGAGHGTAGDYPYHGQGVHGVGLRSALYQTFAALAARLRYVRVACGDWTRVLTPSVTWRHGTTAIYLDPPYSDEVRAKGLYAVDSGEVAAEVLRWCREHGADTRLRIALSGFDNEAHGDALTALGWSVLAWQAKGGYGGQRKRGAPNDNAARERVWFSPGCLAADPVQRQLFDVG